MFFRMTDGILAIGTTTTFGYCFLFSSVGTVESIRRERIRRVSAKLENPKVNLAIWFTVLH